MGAQFFVSLASDPEGSVSLVWEHFVQDYFDFEDETWLTYANQIKIQTFSADVPDQFDLEVRAQSSDGSEATKTFVINVNKYDVSKPIDVDNTYNTVLETLEIGSTVGITAFSEDLDQADDIVSYNFGSSDQSNFEIDPQTGVVTLTENLDYETYAQHELLIFVESSDGSVSSETFILNVENVNEHDVSSITNLSDSESYFVFENVPVGTLVGITAFAEDLDAPDSVSYSLIDNFDASSKLIVKLARSVRRPHWITS